MTVPDAEREPRWSVVCPDGKTFHAGYFSEREAATIAALIDTGQMFPFHGMTCWPHEVRRV